jgi:hypothetical protein
MAGAATLQAVQMATAATTTFWAARRPEATPRAARTAGVPTARTLGVAASPTRGAWAASSCRPVWKLPACGARAAASRRRVELGRRHLVLCCGMDTEGRKQPEREEREFIFF